VTYSVFVQLQESDTNPWDTPATQTITGGRHQDWIHRFEDDYADCRCIPLRTVRRTENGNRLSIGRSRQSDVFVNQRSVSKHHATLILDHVNGEFTLIDESSRNGTYLNGDRIAAGADTAIWPGAHLCFGDAAFVFIDSMTLRKLAKLAG